MLGYRPASGMSTMCMFHRPGTACGHPCAEIGFRQSKTPFGKDRAADGCLRGPDESPPPAGPPALRDRVDLRRVDRRHGYGRSDAVLKLREDICHLRKRISHLLAARLGDDREPEGAHEGGLSRRQATCVENIVSRSLREGQKDFDEIVGVGKDVGV